MFLLCLKHIFLDTKNFRGYAPVVAGLYILQVRYEPHLSDKVLKRPGFQLRKYGMPK